MIYYMDLCFAHGNDCAIQIAVSVCGNIEEFAKLMNKKAEALGLKDSHFVTPHGLDIEEHYTTAYELAIISDYALNIKKIREVVKTLSYTVNINGYPKTIKNSNELLGYLKGVNGVKTGFTNGAGRCLVTSVERNGFNIITVVLGAETKKNRKKDSIELIEYIYSNYELVNLKEMVEKEFINWLNINRGRIQVYKAKDNYIDISLDNNLIEMYPIKNENVKDIKINIENSNFRFDAPIYKNTPVALVKVSVKDNEIIYYNIIINNNIERKNWMDYFIKCLKLVI